MPLCGPDRLFFIVVTHLRRESCRSYLRSTICLLFILLIQEMRDVIQRHDDESDVRRQPALDRQASPLVANDRFDDDRASHPSWDNDQSFVTITGCDVEAEFSHHESLSEKAGFPPSLE